MKEPRNKAWNPIPRNLTVAAPARHRISQRVTRTRETGSHHGRLLERYGVSANLAASHWPARAAMCLSPQPHAPVFALEAVQGPSYFWCLVVVAFQGSPVWTCSRVLWRCYREIWYGSKVSSKTCSTLTLPRTHRESRAESLDHQRRRILGEDQCGQVTVQEG
jgi:hypothetical protein